MNILSRYARWLHTGWPAGTVEKLPEVGEGGVTSVPGVRVVGDLTGVPLLKFSADSGARAIEAIVKELAEPDLAKARGADPERLDVAIVGGGVSGIAAALSAKRAGLRFQVFEAATPFSTIVNFPKGKPIFTYPTEMKPAGELRLSAEVKEALLDELEQQRAAAGVEIEKAHVERVERKGGEIVVHIGGKEKRTVRALRAIIAIGRSGNYRRLGVPGEKLDKVYQRLYDPREYGGKQALVVGGGDSAIESSVALALAGAHVVLSYRGAELSRAKPENVEKLERLARDPAADVQIERPVSERVTAAMSANMPAVTHGTLTLMLGSKLKEIREEQVVIEAKDGREQTLHNDVVFSMIGREAPLDFFRRSGIPIRGEWRASTWAGFAAFFLFCCFIYNWKASTDLNAYFSKNGLFPFNLPKELGDGAFLKSLAVSLRQPGFYYSLAYSIAIALFGWQRVRRRDTPYIKWQTISLAAVQILPLFLMPYFLLPMAGYAGAFDGGVLGGVADHLFPKCSYDYGREYWRAFGLILAWPLFFWNVFTSKPMYAWLAISLVQTCVIIPFIVWRWGKGAYCGWICSCGALAETMGDEHRTKMPHGPRWNRLNLVGQAILGFSLLLVVARVATWYFPGTLPGRVAKSFYDALFYSHSVYDYYHVVDLFLAGVVGVAFYFWASGRVWCRFFCPLAALMHVYARFSQFRIFADKKKCISCNVCTSVCHQGIDVMSFANKGLPMQDPECVRCSACVQSCPTGTLRFGRESGGAAIYDRLPASPVQMREGKVHLSVIGG